MFIVITPRAFAPRVTGPPVIDPEIVCELAVTAAALRTKNVRIDISALVFIKY
jgi:hypothetical protein